jgi:hypothetical protein
MRRALLLTLYTLGVYYTRSHIHLDFIIEDELIPELGVEVGRAAL